MFWMLHRITANAVPLSVGHGVRVGPGMHTVEAEFGSLWRHGGGFGQVMRTINGCGQDWAGDVCHGTGWGSLCVPWRQGRAGCVCHGSGVGQLMCAVEEESSRFCVAWRWGWAGDVCNCRGAGSAIFAMEVELETEVGMLCVP